MGKRHIWTKEEEDYIRLHYPTEALIDISDHLHISPATIKEHAVLMGVKKADNYDPRQFQHRYVKNYVHEKVFGRA